jgi:hypothetical protein
MPVFRLKHFELTKALVEIFKQCAHNVEPISPPFVFLEPGLSPQGGLGSLADRTLKLSEVNLEKGEMKSPELNEPIGQVRRQHAFEDQDC